MTSLRMLRVVAAVDAANVATLLVLSPEHGRAAASGYAPAAVATVLAHVSPRRRRIARLLCVLGLAPNTVLAVRAAGRSRRSRVLSAYVAVGGAALGVGYVRALRRGPG